MVTIVVVSLILAVTPTVMTSDIDVTFLHSCHKPDDDHEDKDEMAFQMKQSRASQKQLWVENGQVVWDGESIGSGNNVDLFFNDNIGNLALGQK